MSASIFSGHCHCGAVQFDLAPPILELTTCDCSLCAMRGVVMARVPEASLAIRQGRESLTLYRWNTQRARHYFCSLCGIYVFHRKRAAPGHFGVNVHCLEGFDTRGMPVRATAGAAMSVESAGARSHWPGPRVVDAGLVDAQALLHGVALVPDVDIEGGKFP